MSGIMFIDAEQPFANDMVSVLKGRGFSVQLLDDSDDALKSAAKSAPDLIVLCVELPGKTGYGLCNKLKKDPDLKGVPLIITSKEATQETFAQHKRLKTRAEDYLIKPFGEQELLDKIAGLIAMPSNGHAAIAAPLPAVGTGEFDSLSAELSLDDVNVPAMGNDDFDAESLLDDLEAPLQPPARTPTPPPLVVPSSDFSLDDDLASLDAPLAPPTRIVVEPRSMAEPRIERTDPPTAVKVEQAVSRLSALPTTNTPSPASNTDLAALQTARRESSDLKAKVAELEARLRAADEARAAANTSQAPGSASSARELLNMKEQLRAKDKELANINDQVFEKEKQIVEITEQLEQMQGTLQQRQGDVSARDVDISSLRARVGALTDERDELEQQVQGRLQQAEQARDALQQETEQLRQMVRDAEGDTHKAREEAANWQSEVKVLERRAQRAESELKQLEVVSKQHEENATQSFSRLKADERSRDKAKEALEVALQLLRGDVAG